MRSRYKITPQSNVYFITTTTHLWVPVLFNETIFQIIIDSLKYCQQHKQLRVHGYVLMFNHIHAIISHPQAEQISSVMRDFKRHTSTEIQTYLSSLGRFSQLFWIKLFHSKAAGENKLWQAGYHPVTIYSPSFFEEKLNYMHYNPVKKGFVTRPEYWNYSSASYYLLGNAFPLAIDGLAE